MRNPNLTETEFTADLGLDPLLINGSQMNPFTKILSMPILLAALCIQTSVAQAQDDMNAGNSPATEAPATLHEHAPAATNEGWKVMLGAGPYVRPTYEGSNRYTVVPVPVFNATYNDMLAINNGGVNVYWHDEHIRLGAGLTYQGGRNDRKSGSFLSRGDDRLIGMGKVKAAMGMRAFGSYSIEHVELSTALTQFTGGNHGLLLDMGAAFPFKATERLVLKPHVNATWANGTYMQPLFGVTAAQAANSRFTRFNAGAGLKDVSIGLNANYGLDRNWFLGFNADAKRLTGDAAKSPLSLSNTQIMVMSMVGYQF